MAPADRVGGKSVASNDRNRSKGKDPFGNNVLDSLSDSDRIRLEQILSWEPTQMKTRLYEPGARIKTVYFPVEGVVSVLTTMQDGGAVEIATIGNEGMVGTPLFLGSQFMPARDFAQVQVPGGVLSMDAASFQSEVDSNRAFRGVVQRYVQALFSQISQQVACNGLHTVEERCCRWLLLTHDDRVQSDEFPLTQEFLSQMLGVRRASVTLAAGALQRAGFIEYRRGRMRVVDVKTWRALRASATRSSATNSTARSPPTAPNPPVPREPGDDGPRSRLDGRDNRHRDPTT